MSVVGWRWCSRSSPAWRGTLAAVVLACAAVSACSSGDEQPTPPTGTVSPLAWSPCGDGLDCATVAVPRHHDDPDGPRIELAVTRRAATGASLGPLVVHPGGPGAPTRPLVASSAWPAGITERFDLIGVDPRGVGGSVALRCSSAPEIDTFRATDSAPSSPEGLSTLESAAAAVSDVCATADADVLDELGTDIAVRDLDVVRRALGVEQLSFAMFSYGTAVGLAYAEAFGPQVRAMVLDGVVDPELDLLGLLEGQASGLDASLVALDRSCRATGAVCAVPEVLDTFDVVEAGLLADPGGPGASTLRLAAIAASYEPALADDLVDALAAALDGDTVPLERLAERYSASGDFASYAATLCRDRPHPADPGAWADAADRVAPVAPRLGAATLNELLPCATWPVETIGQQHPIAATSAPTILVVANIGDVVTPVAWAEAVASDLDDAVLLRFAGEGHASLFRSACVQDVVTRYLVELGPPPNGTSC